MGENGETYRVEEATVMATPARKKVAKRSSLEDEEFFNLLQGSDPIRFELNRLQNEVKGINFLNEIFARNYCFQDASKIVYGHKRLIKSNNVIRLKVNRSMSFSGQFLDHDDNNSGL